MPAAATPATAAAVPARSAEGRRPCTRSSATRWKNALIRRPSYEREDALRRRDPPLLALELLERDEPDPLDDDDARDRPPAAEPLDADAPLELLPLLLLPPPLLLRA